VKRLIAIVAVGATAASALAAQGDVARLTGRVPPDVAAAVSALVDSAHARHLPAGPLIDKALEGATKGAAPERIVTAVHDVLGRLDRAAVAIATDPADPARAEEVEAGAFALSAGLTDGDIGEIARTAPRGQPTIVALQVAGALAALGVPRAQTVSLVRAEIQSGRPLGDLSSLTGQVQAAMAGGVPAAAAAAGLERAAAAHATPHGQAQGRSNPHKP
jgi:hypothetical protein